VEKEIERSPFSIVEPFLPIRELNFKKYNSLLTFNRQIKIAIEKSDLTINMEGDIQAKLSKHKKEEFELAIR